MRGMRWVSRWVWGMRWVQGVSGEYEGYKVGTRGTRWV